MLTRPVLTPGRAYSVGANARRGAAPCPTAYNIRRWSLPHYGEQAATPPPPKNSVAAVRAAAMPGRRILNAAGAGQGLGSPASADARPAGGGAKPRAALASPHQIRPERRGTRRAHRLSVLDSSGQAFGVKKGPEGPSPGIPYLPLFCVEVRHIFHAGLLYVGHCRVVKAA